MSTALQLRPNTQRVDAASALHNLVPELVALGMLAKQAHWNLTGPCFLPLHALTDELAADVISWTDRVAERAVALEYSVDARPSTVAAAAPWFPAGPVNDVEVVAELADQLGSVAATAHRALEVLGAIDPVGHDITVQLIEGIEKYRWMLRAHNHWPASHRRETT